MRMFVAAIPPEPVIEDLEEFVSVRRDAGAFRWTPPEHWHLTLAFMGQVPDRSYDDLLARLERAARKRHSLAARVAGGGAFPNAARARVLYAGVELSEADTVEVRRLATGAKAAAAKAGAPVDGARFRPHLTLARTGRPQELTSWVRLLDAYRGPDWRIDRISLVASYLGEGPRRRPRYEVREDFLLS